MKKLLIRRIFLSGFALSTAVLSVILLVSQLIPGNFLFETMVSFLPYQLIVSILAIGLFCLLYLRYNKRLNIFTRTVKYSQLGAIGLLLLLSLSTGFQILSFSFVQNTPQIQQISAGATDKNTTTNKTKLRVAFFNKLYTNKEYEQISAGIKQLNPDLISFAEFTSNDLAGIQELKNYPYQVLSKQSEFFLATQQAIFSKYPLTDISKEIDELLPFLSVSVAITPSESIRVISIHTAAPINQKYYNLRSEQLSSLAKLLNHYNYPDYILMGDFNLTPWSPVFRSFQAELPANTVNLAQGRGFQFTWTFSDTLPLRLQLDQLYFRGTNWQSSGLKIAGNYGSDHNLVYTDLSFS